MTVSVFSVIMSMVFSSLILWVTGILISHAKRVRWGLILMIFLLGFIRMVLPVELTGARVIRSWKLYPWGQQLLKESVFGNWTMDKILIAIYVLGILITFLGFLRKLRGLWEVRARAVPVIEGDYLQRIFSEAVECLGYQGKMRVATTKEFSTAVSVGIFTPVILIPKEMLEYPEKELLGVIKHELTHYLRGDVGKQWLLNVAQCFLWWNPAMYYLKRCVMEMLELECDERACRGMSDEERIAYLEAIKRVLESGRKKEQELGMGYGKNHSFLFLKRRFCEVLEPVERYTIGQTRILAVLCLILFLASYAVILQPAGVPKNTDEAKYDIFTEQTVEEQFILHYTDGTYLYVSNLRGITYLTEEEIKKPPYQGLPIFESKKGD